MASATVENFSGVSDAPPAARARLALFDAARLAAAFSIVWLHTPRSAVLAHWSLFGRFAVPFFSAAAVFFVIDGLRRHPRRSVRQYAINRFQRIYVPFLAWSAIYLAFKWIKSLVLPEQPNEFPGIEALWTGTFFHLWFMPFVLLATLGVFVLGRMIVGRGNLEWLASACGLLAGLAIAVMPPPRWVSADTAFSLLAWQTLPAVCWAWSLAVMFPRRLARFFSRPIVTFTAVIAFLGLLVALALTGRNTLIENLAGMMFLLAALQPKCPQWIARIAPFGSLAYGIYLCHLLVIKVLESVAAKCHLAITWQLDLYVFALAAAGSTLLAWSLTRSTRTRWLAA